MHRRPILLLLAFSTTISHAQNIVSALHFSEISEYKYGKPDRIIETNTFHNSNGTQVDKNIKTFDTGGMPLMEEPYDETGKLTAKLTYINDTISHLCLKRIFERWAYERYSKETAIYSYDSHSFLTGITDVDANGNTTTVSEIANNEKGDPLELHLYDGRGRSFGVEKAIYFYDKNVAITTVFSNEGLALSTDTLTINYNKIDTFSAAKKIQSTWRCNII